MRRRNLAIFCAPLAAVAVACGADKPDATDVGGATVPPQREPEIGPAGESPSAGGPAVALRRELAKERRRSTRLRRELRRARVLSTPLRFVRAALAQQGDPYVWGAKGPDAFDCSGLVRWSGQQVGYDLPGYTGALIRLGKSVARSAARPGDLFFPHSGHVSICLNNACRTVVNAPHSGAVVRVERAREPWAIRRVVV